MELDFEKVARSLDAVAGDLMKVYTSTLAEAVIVAGSAAWLRELAAALRSYTRTSTRYEPSAN